MNPDMPAQLAVNFGAEVADTWRAACEHPDISDDDAADMQNDIGYAFGVLSELEENFFKQFGHHHE